MLAANGQCEGGEIAKPPAPAFAGLRGFGVCHDLIDFAFAKQSYLPIPSTFFHFLSTDLGDHSSMPRNNPLVKREREICARLCQFRRQTGLSRVAFGRQINLDSKTLSNIEYGRTRLRFDIAERVALTFGLNLRWLAENKPPVWGHHAIHPAAVPDARRPFSEVYDKYLKQKLNNLAKIQACGIYVYSRPAAGVPRGINPLAGVMKELERQATLIQPGLWTAFRMAIIAAAEQFVAQYGGSRGGKSE